MATILTKKKDTTGAPSAGDLTNSTGGAELAVNTADKRLYTKDSGGNVVEIGTNPTSITTGTLNTSGAVVFNDAGADVDFRVEGDTEANLLFVDASADAIGIGTNAPTSYGIFAVQTQTNNAPTLAITGSSLSPQLNHYITDSGSTVRNLNRIGFVTGSSASDNYQGYITFSTTPGGGSGSLTERMRIDSSGNLLVGTTSSIVSDGSGIALQAGGRFVSRYTDASTFDRRSTDGTIINFQKDGTTVGSIGAASGRPYFATDNGSTGSGIYLGVNLLAPTTRLGVLVDNQNDLGAITFRWDDVYATNGTIQTSDANEKQDIEELSEAETRVAVAAKGLLKKYRWKSAVAEKGDDARIHFGIIAQDLKAAFEAEGLDAHRYGMFMWNEWWETQTEIPAVEAQEAVYETQTDEEGNEVQVLVSEAVEGKEAYTRTDTYQTEEEAPEGAVRKERMGIRYNELLAFIIAAI